MKTKYAGETITLTPRFIKALKELMKAECEIMAGVGPEHADLWTWGKCDVSDLGMSNYLSFHYGGDEDRPPGPRWQVRVVTRSLT